MDPPDGAFLVAGDPPQQEDGRPLGALFNSLGDAVLFARWPDRRILDVNPAFCKLFGVSREEAIQATTEVIYPSEEDFQRAGKFFAPTLTEGRHAQLELTLRRGDGTTFPAELRVSPISRTASGQVTGLSIIRDLTEQRRLEAANRAQQERLEALLNAQSQLGNAIVIFTPDGIEWTNDAFASLLGYSAEEVLAPGFDLWALVDPAEQGELRAMEARRLAGEMTTFRYESTLRHRDGRLVPVEVASKPEQAGGRYRDVTVIRDISARKAQEASLRENADAFETLAAATAKMSAQLELANLVQAITDAAVEVTHASFGAYFYNVVDERGEAYQLYTVSGVPREMFSKFPMPRATAVFAPTFNGEAVVRSDDITKDARYGHHAPHHGMPRGHLPVRSYLAVPVRTRSGGVHGGLFLGHPEPGRFTQQHERLVETLAAQASVAIDNARLYEEARASEQRLRTVFEHAPVQVVTTDAEGIIQTINRTLSGKELALVLGKRVGELVLPEDAELVRTALANVSRTGEPAEYEARAIIPHKGTRWFRVHVAPLGTGPGRGLVLISSDITETKEAELELVRVRTQLSQGEKLAALGSLVSGVAHELRTPLTFLGTNAFLAQQRIAKTARSGGSAEDALAQAQPFFTEVTAAIDRINLLVEDLRKYTRARGQDELLEEDLKEVVDEAVQLFRATNRSTHRILARYEETKPSSMRRGAVQQLVLNLLQNAVEASPSGATVNLEVRNTPDGPQVEVRDEGSGMPPALLARIYEPLFTTKPTGTGLGLTIVKRIADEHKATISCDSAPGEGTRFVVTFPRAA